MLPTNGADDTGTPDASGSAGDVELRKVLHPGGGAAGQLLRRRDRILGRENGLGRKIVDKEGGGSGRQDLDQQVMMRMTVTRGLRKTCDEHGMSCFVGNAQGSSP